MLENIETDYFKSNDSDLGKIAELYCMTFFKDDYSLENKENIVRNIRKHADYEGFIGLKCKDATGNLIGFAYGYTSLPKQFYRRKIADQLLENEIDTWLSDCFEFVELAVEHTYKRLGIASKLHDELLMKTNCRTAVLTTGVQNKPAVNLYKKKGWEVVKKDAPIISEDNLQVIMGKKVNGMPPRFPE
ncbi:GNAT family N-acetyltransferase [Oceanobacillus neutriphilus]|uniref:N-acetyltransferase n=1 Tax=Oceanobacillus neutriphilus TaxID=531815 RepID=A0ABQ2NRA8_9BACI|nr:GNAT family N-acetyltransferase [Oceanobacillus neutriphilus]GGP09875.1 N-acetyltransferase [Oceanobacillus neutriphilus]